jgi:hypothetical protein
MALPSISTPEFTTQIPSTGETIKYRPFLVKEEKILLMALEGNDNAEINDAVQRILNSCIIDDIDTNNLSTFDIEYLFLQLRGKSVGEVIELTVTHPKGDCTHKTEIAINVDEIQLVNADNEKKIMLTDDVGVMMKYPTMKETLSVSSVENETDTMFKLISMSVDYVFDMENVYNDFTEKEIEDWINTLNQSQFKKIVEFFQNMPKLEYDIEWTCESCGKKDEVKLEGLQSFFT